MMRRLDLSDVDATRLQRAEARETASITATDAVVSTQRHACGARSSWVMCVPVRTDPHSIQKTERGDWSCGARDCSVKH